MHDVFISYTRQDSGVALRLANALQPYHLSTCLDVETLVAGEEFSVQVAREIAEARAVVLVLSRHAQRSHWVKQELVSALEGDKLVVPLLLDDEATHNWIWPLVSDRQAIKVDKTTDFDELALQLRRAITRVEMKSSERSAAKSFSDIEIGEIIGPVAFGGTAGMRGNVHNTGCFPTINDITWGDLTQHQRLKILLTNLEAALQKMPSDRLEDAQRISEMTDVLVSESSRKSPNTSFLNLGAEGLIEAADAVKDIAPDVRNTATEIATLLGQNH
ncbi:toll/interleukin-1 receptor domain-containing protein [Leptolyngbya iicbica]|uniref:Toll/interleukin-1 receptor domain-containing protein n=2 Tax=Cyanophyceae TaxID=3028117 RepID=A0A4Q7EFB9_9CYAN|nr:toll/interleukin-1 receptor domain-containing protein [Leptolyngbya sp. LK]RZM81975.1 toll/interleukin-1 receptor domain-containing protein [Leptolyngbya sp. LK]